MPADPQDGSGDQAAYAPSQSGPTLDRAIACVGCGYLLLGMRIGGRCPECGLPVAKSIERGALRRLSPEQLDTLQRAMKTVLIAAAVLLGAALLSVPLDLMGGPYELLSSIAMAIATAVSVWAWMQFSSTPLRPVARVRGQLRRRLWILVVTSSLAAIGALAASISWRVAWLTPADQAIRVCVILVWAAGIRGMDGVLLVSGRIALAWRRYRVDTLTSLLLVLNIIALLATIAGAARATIMGGACGRFPGILTLIWSLVVLLLFTSVRSHVQRIRNECLDPDGDPYDVP